MKKIDYGLGTAVGVVMLEIQSGDDSPMLKVVCLLCGVVGY
jgi:hypothetical protein